MPNSLRSFITHRLVSGIQFEWNRHSLNAVHSPFVFQLMTCVWNNALPPNVAKPVEALRSELLRNTAYLDVEDFGALKNSGRTSVRSIAKRALMPYCQSKLLAQLIQQLRANQVLELGTSLGITAAYFSLLNPTARIVSIEGSNEIAELAKENLRKLGANNVEVICNQFEYALNDFKERDAQFDFVLIDGNHQYLPTMQYFEQLLPMLREDAVLVFHDIYWSNEMTRAWKEICGKMANHLILDFYHFGIIFMNATLTPVYYRLRIPN